MLHSGKHALPLALATGLAFSASAQAPPDDRETIWVWSSRDRIVHERLVFTSPPQTEISPPPAVDRDVSASRTSRLLICEPGLGPDLLDGRAPESARKDSESEIAGRFSK